MRRSSRQLVVLDDSGSYGWRVFVPIYDEVSDAYCHIDVDRIDFADAIVEAINAVLSSSPSLER